MQLKQCEFVLSDIKCNQLNIERYYHCEKEAFGVAEVSCAVGDALLTAYMERQNELSGEFEDASGVNTDCQVEKDYNQLLKAMNCHFLLVVWKSQDEDRLLFFSDTRRVRALEILDYLIAEFGLVRGDAGCASGQISSAILSVQIADMELADSVQYFLRMVTSYYEDCEWVEAARYGIVHSDEIAKMTRYYKKKIAWAYVNSTDVVSDGEQIRIKTLENESGMLMVADENRYIMIGCRGEVYDMTKEKFERTYEATDEPLDVFEQMLDFLPAIEKVSDGDYISLDEVAHLCYPQRGTGIYACELQRRTKVFPTDGNAEYFLGRPGDYMAIRMDDFTDIYVIQREIFLQTYEAKA